MTTQPTLPEALAQLEAEQEVRWTSDHPRTTEQITASVDRMAALHATIAGRTTVGQLRRSLAARADTDTVSFNFLGTMGPDAPIPVHVADPVHPADPLTSTSSTEVTISVEPPTRYDQARGPSHLRFVHVLLTDLLFAESIHDLRTLEFTPASWFSPRDARTPEESAQLLRDLTEYNTLLFTAQVDRVLAALRRSLAHEARFEAERHLDDWSDERHAQKEALVTAELDQLP
jgi:hypothetical protein